MNETPEFIIFLHELSRILRDLYDPMALQKSPLQGYFGLKNRVDPISALRDALIDSIQQIKPDPKVPVDSAAFRYYQILLFRFVQQSSQKEVAADFSLSIRQLRRLEKQALHFLADSLINRHGPFEATPEMLRGLNEMHEIEDDESTEVESSPAAAEASFVEAVPSSPVSGPSMPDSQQELARLMETGAGETLDLAALLETALQTVQPLLRANGMEVAWEAPANLPAALGQATALRHALIHTLIAASSASAGAGSRVLHAAIDAECDSLHLQLTAPVQHADHVPPLVTENLQSAAQLLALFGGAIEGPTAGLGSFSIHLRIPAVSTLRVLVVDDNQDVLLLLERYCSGTRYAFIGTRDPAHAIALAEAHDIHIIVLDVMMPGVDGWELLGRMRAHPRLREAPVLVCSILPQESLAMVLGAAGFVRKPVSREAFLFALEQSAGLLDRAAR